MIIRVASSADTAVLASLHAASFEDAWDQTSFSRLLDRNGCFALLAKCEDALANDLQAFILIQVVAQESEILSFATHPSARRLGLARGLLWAASVEAEKRGAKEMFLEVAEDNEAAQALYRRAGFSPVGHRTGYYHREKAAVSAVILRAGLPLRY